MIESIALTSSEALEVYRSWYKEAMNAHGPVIGFVPGQLGNLDPGLMRHIPTDCNYYAIVCDFCKCTLFIEAVPSTPRGNVHGTLDPQAPCPAVMRPNFPDRYQ